MAWSCGAKEWCRRELRRDLDKGKAVSRTWCLVRLRWYWACAMMPAKLVRTPTISVMNIVADQLFVCRVGRNGRIHAMYMKYRVVGMVMN